MATKRFQLFNTMHGETIAIVELDEALLNPDAGILDAETLTLRPIKNGGIYTLYPIVDHSIAILEQIRQNYDRLTKQPSESLGGYIHNMDALTDAVGALFQDVAYIVIESADDLSKVINPPKSGDYEPKMKKYDVMADLLEAVKARLV